MRTRTKWPLHVLLAEDTDTDAELFRMAVAKCGRVRSLNVVEDGEEFIDYMMGAGAFENIHHPMPDIIFLDLKMPKQDGLDVLGWLKEHPEHSLIPKIILSNSAHEVDVQRAYELCANVFFKKPTSFFELVALLKLTFEFWSRCERPKPAQLQPRRTLEVHH